MISIVIGNLGQDPEVRFLPDGTQVATVSVANNIRVNKEDIVEWTRVTFWRKDAENVAQYFKKGDGIIVVGFDLHTVEYVGKSGAGRADEMTGSRWFFPPGKRASDGSAAGQNSTQGNGASDSDIPF